MNNYITEYLPSGFGADTDFSKAAAGQYADRDYSTREELLVKKEEKLAKVQEKKTALSGDTLTAFNAAGVRNAQDGYVEVNRNTLSPNSIVVPGVNSGYYPKELVDKYFSNTSSTLDPEQAKQQAIEEKYQKDLLGARLDNRGFVGDTVAAAKSLAANIGRGAINLGQSAGELATLPFQETYNAILDKNVDWNLYSDDTAKKMSEGIDSLIGYDRVVDDLASARVKESFEKSGFDILNPSTYSNVLDVQGFGSQLVDVIPAAVGGLGDIIGGGAALKVGGKVGIAALNKAIPSLGKQVDEFTTLNKTKAIDDLKALKSTPGLTPLQYKDGILAIEVNYNLGKKIPDIIKGNSMSNAYFLTQMDENLEKFKENNNGVTATPEQMLRMAVVTKFMAELQASSASKITGIGQLDTSIKAAKESALKSVLATAGSTAGKSTYEGVQEALDEAANQVNQKYESADYKGKTVADIISDSSADIATATVLGPIGGGVVGGAKDVLTSNVLSEAAETVTGKIKGVGTESGEQATSNKPSPYAVLDTDEERVKASAYVQTLFKYYNNTDNQINPKITADNLSEVVDSLYSVKADRKIVEKLKAEDVTRVDTAYGTLIEDLQKVIEANPQIKLTKPLPVDPTALASGSEATVVNSSEEATRAANLIELLLENRNVSDEFVEKLKVTAEYNGVDLDTYSTLVGKYRTVFDEAVTGKRGWDTYVKNGDVPNLTRMLGSTVKSYNSLQDGINQATELADRYNSTGVPLGKPVTVETSYKKDNGKLFDIQVKPVGGKWVADTTQAAKTLAQKENTILGIKSGLEKLGQKFNTTAESTASSTNTKDQVDSVSDWLKEQIQNANSNLDIGDVDVDALLAGGSGASTADGLDLISDEDLNALLAGNVPDTKTTGISQEDVNAVVEGTKEPVFVYEDKVNKGSNGITRFEAKSNTTANKYSDIISSINKDPVLAKRITSILKTASGIEGSMEDMLNKIIEDCK